MMSSTNTGLFVPTDVVSGCIPHVPGEEDQVVYNAAADACDSERVAMAWSVSGDKIWFIAVRGAELANAPGSWCPLAALLPGMPDGLQPPCVMLYTAGERASVMTVDYDGLQVISGSTAVIRAKAQLDAADLDVEITDVNSLEPVLRPVHWRTLGIVEERVRRRYSTISILSGVTASALAVAAWVAATAAMPAVTVDYERAQQNIANATSTLLRSAAELSTSSFRQQISGLKKLDWQIMDVGGVITQYEIKGGQTSWEAEVPRSVTADRIQDLGARTDKVSPQGSVIIKGGAK